MVTQVQIGELTVNDPMGPDSYGYYIYDMNDNEYEELAPEYNWIEIDPDYGGDGNVIEPDGSVVAIGSGGGFAQAAASAFIQTDRYTAKQIAEKSLIIAAELCIYTNDTITILEI